MTKTFSKNIYFVIALIFLGIFFFTTRFNDTPGIIEIRANPELMDFSDYETKIDLHTRLSTLFPYGSKERDVINFFEMAKIEGEVQPDTECSYYITYQGRATFIFGKQDQFLKAIQVDDWPAYNEICAKTAATAEENNDEGADLPLMPLPPQ